MWDCPHPPVKFLYDETLFYFLTFCRQEIRWARSRCLVPRCNFVHSSQWFPTFRRVDPSGASGTRSTWQVPDPVLHVDRLRKSAQEISRTQSRQTRHPGGRQSNIHILHLPFHYRVYQGFVLVLNVV